MTAPVRRRSAYGVQEAPITSIGPNIDSTYEFIDGDEAINLMTLAPGLKVNLFASEKQFPELAKAVPEIYALPAVGDRVVLNIVDALICQYEGGERGLLHYSTVLDELRFSLDPVALDVLSIRDISNFRKEAGTKIPKATMELYSNATLLEIGQSDLKKIVVDRVP